MRVAEIVGTLLILFVCGSGAVPDVNEAHYWTKARHFWDPTFAVGDFFLSSANAHACYYGSIGWLTQWVSLPSAAWIGRFLGWTCLAGGWYALCAALVPRRGACLLGVALWVALLAHSQMSGEWVVGGCEAKVFAYALVLFGWSCWVRGRERTTWILLGLAAAMHVLVGGWAVILTASSLLVSPRMRRQSGWQNGLGLAIGGVCSLAGLLPALRLNTSVPAEIVQRATEIYVTERLPHHLMLRAFPSLFVLRHVLVISVFALLWRQVRRDERGQRLWGVIWASIGVTICGAAIDGLWGDTPLGIRLLRFYWFRASDVFVPLGVTLAGLVWLERYLAPVRPTWARLSWSALAVAMTAYLAGRVVELGGQPVAAADRQGGIHSAAELRDWQELCYWIRDHVPPAACVLTPPDQQTFKWYAERAEVVTWKDVPQDASGLLEWKQRLADVQAWRGSPTAPTANMWWERLRSRYSFQYVVLRQSAGILPADLPTLFQNPHYRLLRVAPLAATTPAAAP